MSETKTAEPTCFFHEFHGEKIREGVPPVYGKCDVEVFLEDGEIQQILVDGIEVDFELPYTSGNIVQIAKEYLEDIK